MSAASAPDDQSEKPRSRQQKHQIEEIGHQFAMTKDGSDYYDPVSSRRAAVLVGLFPAQDDGEWHVLLTRRSNKLRSHSGEVCLPGGKNDVGETNIETALRESDEEIGLKRDSVVKVLGEMPPRLSAHLLSVTPMVCIIERPILDKKRTRSSAKSDKTFDDGTFVVTPNPHEVESVFTVPLKLFHQSSPQHSFYDYTTFYNYTVRIHEFQYKFDGNEYCIWGLTAHILIHAAARVYGGSASNSSTDVIELDPPGLPRHIDLRVAEKTTDEEEHKIVVSVCSDG